MVVIDIAPCGNSSAGHEDVSVACLQWKAQSQTRQQAKPILESEIADPSVVQFMLKSFLSRLQVNFSFQFDRTFRALCGDGLAGSFANTPTLFIKGGFHLILKPEYTETILNNSLMRPVHYQWFVGTGFMQKNLIL